MRSALAGGRTLAGSDRGLLAYGRRLQGQSEAAALPVGRGILAYGRKLQSVETDRALEIHEGGVVTRLLHCIMSMQTPMLLVPYCAPR